MRAKALLLLTLAFAIGVSAGELCRQGDAVKIVIVDFWERPVEFRYNVHIGHSFWAGRGLELNLRGTNEWLVVSTLGKSKREVSIWSWPGGVRLLWSS